MHAQLAGTSVDRLKMHILSSALPTRWSQGSDTRDGYGLLCSVKEAGTVPTQGRTHCLHHRPRPRCYCVSPCKPDAQVWVRMNQLLLAAGDNLLWLRPCWQLAEGQAGWGPVLPHHSFLPQQEYLGNTARISKSHAQPLLHVWSLKRVTESQKFVLAPISLPLLL